jgi:ribosomal protein L13
MQPIYKAVYRKLSKEHHRRAIIDRLKVYAEADHPHEGNIFKDYTNGKGIPKTVSLADIEEQLKQKQQAS